jgi:hypothetical protein
MSYPVFRRTYVQILLPAISLLSFQCLAGEPAAKVDFVKDIKPIFEASCNKCHGAEKPKGELRLDSKVLAMKGGSSGPSILPGKSKDSLLIQRILGLGDEARMPVKSPPLSAEKTALIAAWIDQGAEWPDSASVADAKIEKHWAYTKPVQARAPAVKNTSWVKNPIDAFVLARLEKENMTPAPEASKETLLRRLSFDLIGLPPTVEEIDAFLADKSPNAYEKQVERLLASPHHGERWARPWLDAARYADTNGFNFDSPRSIWKFRDWVVNALNSDMPFSQFTIEQIAGDMLPNATQDQKVATGFHRNTMRNEEGGVDRDEARWETLLDRANTTATVWLGSTLACAQCHNHKFDPFRHKDYYQFLAFWENATETSLSIAPPEVVEKRKALQAEVTALETKMKSAAKDEAAKIKKEISALKSKIDAMQSTTLVFEERASTEPPTTDLRLKGSYMNRGEKVQANTPSFLPPIPAGKPQNRLGLAYWLVDENNPLTARVTVNRFWDQYFGRGLVDTVEDFGTQGSRPTHPELLDWLSAEFMKQNWSMKSLHRMIVSSSTYRQSSKLTPEQIQRDPYNKLLARGPRYRMEAEMIRDSVLSISGQLSTVRGGPGVYPPQPDSGFIANNKGAEKWEASPGEARFRRSLYTFWRRTAPFAAYVTFDAISREFCTVKRLRTNTPLQALCALNDEGFFDAARNLAQRVMAQNPDAKQRIAFAFKLCTGRAPDNTELSVLFDAYTRELQHFKNDQKAAMAISKGSTNPKENDVADIAAMTMLANVLLNLDETLTRE